MWCYANEPPQETVANAKFVALYTGSAHARGSDRSLSRRHHVPAPKDHGNVNESRMNRESTLCYF